MSANIWINFQNIFYFREDKQIQFGRWRYSGFFPHALTEYFQFHIPIVVTFFLRHCFFFRFCLFVRYGIFVRWSFLLSSLILLLFCCVEICIYVRSQAWISFWAHHRQGHTRTCRTERVVSFARLSLFLWPGIVNFNAFAFVLFCCHHIFTVACAGCLSLALCVCVFVYMSGCLLVKIMYIFSTFACFVFAYRVWRSFA